MPRPATDLATARPAGALYLAIILLGLTSELALRLPLVSPGDPAATAANIRAAEGLFRLSLAADTAMVAADIALAALLFLLLRPAGALLAALAALFRLAQAAVLGANLSAQASALIWLTEPLPGIDADTAAALAQQALSLHAHGYDLGLVFFGLSSLLTAALLLRLPVFARPIGLLIGAAGLVYLTGSGLRILAPDLAAGFAPAYLIAIVAETALALRLLSLGPARATPRTRPHPA